MTKSKVALMCLGLGLFTLSCENENELSEKNLELDSKSKIEQKVPSLTLLNQERPQLRLPDGIQILGENLRKSLTNEAVEASECGPTEFRAVLNKYLQPIYADPLALELFNLYGAINFINSYYLDRSEQYFGAEGEYTPLMVKRTRNLERFWDMPNQIRVNGQHNSTLNDREVLADVFEAFGIGVETREQAYEIADELLAINEFSPNLPESPFFSADGFAADNRLIVIGDGLVQMVSESGIDAEIVWTGILAHEWAHQIQFKNYEEWYPEGAAEDPAEDTRYTELEADFLAAYYMTHKRGATYNSKRVEQFFNLFFQIGDCSFASPGHHGTPLQRMAAAQLGFELADEAQKNGHILSQEEAHEYFVANIDRLL